MDWRLNILMMLIGAVLSAAIAAGSKLWLDRLGAKTASHEADDLILSYGRSVKIFQGFGAVVAVATSIGVYYVIRNEAWAEKHQGWMVFLMAFICLVFIASLFQMLLTRVAISESSISIRGLASTRTIRHEQIEQIKETDERIVLKTQIGRNASIPKALSGWKEGLSFIQRMQINHFHPNSHKKYCDDLGIADHKGHVQRDPTRAVDRSE